MRIKLSKERKEFWDDLFEEILGSERVKEFPYFYNRLLRWARKNEVGLFQELIRDTRVISKGWILGPKVFEWIETRFIADPSLKPAFVADEVCFQFKINPAMRYYIIGWARRIKKRVMMRKRRIRQQDSYLNDLLLIYSKCEDCELRKYFGI